MHWIPWTSPTSTSWTSWIPWTSSSTSWTSWIPWASWTPWTSSTSWASWTPWTSSTSWIIGGLATAWLIGRTIFSNCNTPPYNPPNKTTPLSRSIQHDQPPIERYVLCDTDYDNGEEIFKQHVLSWTWDDIRRVETLPTIHPIYTHQREYYSDLCCLILEETKEALRQRLHNIEQKEDNLQYSFKLKKHDKFNRSNRKHPFCMLKVQDQPPKQFIEGTRYNIAVWLNFCLFLKICGLFMTKTISKSVGIKGFQCIYPH